MLGRISHAGYANPGAVRTLLWGATAAGLLYVLGYMQGGAADAAFAAGGSNVVHEFFHHARHLGFPCH